MVASCAHNFTSSFYLNLFSLDFMDMKVVGSLLRRSGAFFLRRTFGSDQLYKLIFTLYTQSLMGSNMAPVEFFIEGTRSRTAKSLHPKLGQPIYLLFYGYLHPPLRDVVNGCGALSEWVSFRSAHVSHNHQL